MPSEKLIDVTQNQLLVSGLYKGQPVGITPLWEEHSNLTLRDNSMRRIPGWGQITANIAVANIRALAQAQVATAKRLYFVDGANVKYWESGAPVTLGTVDASSPVSLETFGTWLAYTDRINTPKLYKNGGAPVVIGGAEFTKAKILLRYQNFLMALSTDILPSGFHWSNRSDPETFAPLLTNTAGNLPIREMDSDLMAAVPIGQNIAAYSLEKMALISYTGGQLVMGARIVLDGIGAIGASAVCSVGRENFGMSRQGIWRTDGSGFNYIDRPMVGSWLQETVDWDKGEEVICYHNEVFEQVYFYFTALGGAKLGIAYDYKRNAFSDIDGGVSAAQERRVFSYPIEARSIGPVFMGSQQTAGAAVITARAKTRLLDGGSPQYYKIWDYMVVQGVIPLGLLFRVGYTDDPEVAPDFTDWVQVTHECPFPELRESVYVTIDFQGSVAWTITSLIVYGEVAGASF